MSISLDVILISDRHWALRDQENPLSLNRVKQLCKRYNGNNSLVDFHKYIRQATREHLDVSITKQIWDRMGEFLNGEEQG
ncbi:MAG: hypothetical protein ABIH48_01430 [Candidatus Falkowbacteria bacterium]